MSSNFTGQKRQRDNSSHPPPSRGGFGVNRGGFSGHSRGGGFGNHSRGGGSGSNSRGGGDFGQKKGEGFTNKFATAAAIEKAAAHGYTFVERATSEAAVTFFNAVKEGQAWKVKSKLEQGGKEFINSIDWQGYAPLHYASAKIPISATAFSKPSALLVETLLEVEGIDVEVRDIVPRNHATPLYHAVVSGSTNTIAALLAYRNEKATEKALPACVNVNSVSNNCTPLARAAIIGDANKFRLLLTNDTPAGGADPTLASATGITPLHAAADHGNVAIMELLLKDGRSDINARSGAAQRSVFMCAASPAGGKEAAAKAVEALKLLLGYTGANGEKVDWKATNAKGQTALHIAATWGQTSVIPVLCGLDGLDVNAKDHDGKTALHCAMGASEKFPPHLAVVEELLKVTGIDLDAVDKNGNTALQLCEGKADEEDIQEAFSFARKRNKQ